MSGLSQTQINWLNSVSPYAVNTAAVTGLDPNYILAQAAVESGYGQSGLATGYNNLFGIKGSGSNSVVLPTTECNASGCYRTTGRFATYSSPQASFDAFGNYVNSHGGASNYLKGYATDPNYTSAISKAENLIKSVGINLTGSGSVIGTAEGVLSGIFSGINPVGIGGKIGSAVGIGGASWIQQIRDWLAQSHFWQRLALGVLSLLLIIGAIYLLGSGKLAKIVKEQTT
jgi:hypothetical protein